LAMKQAKSKAISTRIVPVVLFNIPNDTYTIFLDTSGNWALDAGETIISSGSMEHDVDLYGSTFPSHTYGFNNMGFPKTPLIGPYEVYLKNSLGDYVGVPYASFVTDGFHVIDYVVCILLKCVVDA
jgi:hypothetical protein